MPPPEGVFFSAPDAVKYRNLTANRLLELCVDFVDIEDINPEGLLYDENDRLRILEKFKAAGVDGLFLPHCNFGTEYLCARLAKDLGIPVLLWGPLDERPEPDGTRLRDTQCGLFATGKVLRRFGVPFTYLTNCRLSDPVFARGVRDFLAVCNSIGELVKPNFLTQHFEIVLKNNGLKKIRFHDLRHPYVKLRLKNLEPTFVWFRLKIKPVPKEEYSVTWLSLGRVPYPCGAHGGGVAVPSERGELSRRKP